MVKIVEFVLSKLPFITKKLDAQMIEVLKGTCVTMMFRVMAAGLGFCFNLLLARTFGAGGSGLYFLALTIPMIATTFSTMGLNNTMLRFVASNASIENWKAVNGIYSKVMKMVLGVSAILTILLFLISPWLSNVLFRKPELASPMRWSSLALSPLTFIGLQAEALRGLKRIQDWILTSVVFLSFFSLLGLYFVGGRFGVKGVIGVYVASTFVSAGIGFWFWKKASFHFRDIPGYFDIGLLFKSSIPLFWWAILDTMTNWISVLFLGIWSTKEAVGIFGTASRVAMMIGMILLAVNSISAPTFASLIKKKEMSLLNSTARQTTKLMMLLTGPILGIMIIFPGFILGLFGPEFRQGSVVLIVLALGQFINVSTGSVGYLLIMSGNEHLLRNRAIFMLGICLILNLFLIAHWGVVGAAIATATCLATTNLIAVYLVWKKLGIMTIPFLNPKYEDLND